MILKLWIATWPFLSWICPKFIAKKAENLFLTPTRVPRPRSEMQAYESAEKIKLSPGIAAFRWGQKLDPIVILLHGWSGRGTQMAEFRHDLLKHNYQVVALDGPAHGDSEGHQTHVGQFARFLIDVQNELGPFKAVISHSFGTGCSVIARSWGLKVEKLVLVAGPTKYDVMITNYVQRVKLAPRAKNYFYQSLAQKSGLNPEDINIGQIGSKLNTPTLVVHDKDDKAVKYQSALMLKKEWPTIEVLTTEGLGHRRVLKDKSVTKHVANFINS